jgi:hypothetical protein
MNNEKIEKAIRLIPVDDPVVTLTDILDSNVSRITDHKTGVIYLIPEIQEAIIPAQIIPYMPGIEVHVDDSMTVIEQYSHYYMYDSLTDLTNKRDTFIMALKHIHTADIVAEHFSIFEEINKYVGCRPSYAAQAADTLDQINRINDKLWYPALLLSSELVPDSFCINTLKLNDIYHNGKGSVKFADWPQAGYGDYAWDYACLLARGEPTLPYTALLNNNKLVEEVSQRYDDYKFSIRVIICMALVDLLDCAQQLNYNKLCLNETYQIRLNRLVRFVDQSYTTIDYFKYLYSKEVK